MHALRELGGRLLITVGTALGLLVIAVFFDTALAMGEAAWQLVVGLAVATGLAVLALGAIHAAMAASVGRTAIGWWGMVAGRVPPGFGRGDHNLGRAVGDLAAFGLGLPAGLALSRHGMAAGNGGLAIAGLMLAGAAVLFGLVAAVPRLYFALRGSGRSVSAVERAGRRRGRARTAGGAGGADRADDVALLVTAGLLGIALSMCTARTIERRREDDPRRALARGDWARGCVATPATAGCPAAVTITLAPRRARPLRLESLSSCVIALATVDGRPVRARDPAALAALAARQGATDEVRRFELDVDPGVVYRLTPAPPSGLPRCGFSVRYVEVSR